jgi:membrane-bound lytic murein transglycosylase
MARARLTFALIFTIPVLLAAAGGKRPRPRDAAFVPDDPQWIAPRTSSTALGMVAAETLRYLRAIDSSNETLEFVGRIADEDTISGVDRLGDPAFLSRCFSALRWIPDETIPRDQLRLTRYLVFSVEGRAKRDRRFSHALFALPDDEAGLSSEEALISSAQLIRFRFSRQDVAKGAVDAFAAPLVWLTDDGHEQALLQGSIAVQLPGEPSPRLFNVARGNGMPWDRRISDTHRQRAYCYFREVDAVRGYGVEPNPKIELLPEVSVAGDIAQLGAGQLFAIESADGLRLAVLADKGGAFEHNLHQLDLYSGVFPSAAAFQNSTWRTGARATVWILRHRDDDPRCR